jgi:hypothetical protein
MLLLLAYEIIVGEPGNIYWEMLSTICLSAALLGDSIILLFYDARWNATVREILFSARSKIRSSLMNST